MFSIPTPAGVKLTGARRSAENICPSSAWLCSRPLFLEASNKAQDKALGSLVQPGFSPPTCRFRILFSSTPLLPNTGFIFRALGSLFLSRDAQSNYLCAGGAGWRRQRRLSFLLWEHAALSEAVTGRMRKRFINERSPPAVIAVGSP